MAWWSDGKDDANDENDDAIDDTNNANDANDDAMMHLRYLFALTLVYSPSHWKRPRAIVEEEEWYIELVS